MKKEEIIYDLCSAIVCSAVGCKTLHVDVYMKEAKNFAFTFRMTQHHEYLCIYLSAAICFDRLIRPSSWYCVVRKVKTDINLVTQRDMLPRKGKECYSSVEWNTLYRFYLKLACRGVDCLQKCVSLFT
jgi:hypothetical protein